MDCIGLEQTSLLVGNVFKVELSAYLYKYESVHSGEYYDTTETIYFWKGSGKIRKNVRGKIYNFNFKINSNGPKYNYYKIIYPELKNEVIQFSENKKLRSEKTNFIYSKAINPQKIIDLFAEEIMEKIKKIINQIKVMLKKEI